jgi:hypothetical protein
LRMSILFHFYRNSQFQMSVLVQFLQRSLHYLNLSFCLSLGLVWYHFQLCILIQYHLRWFHFYSFSFHNNWKWYQTRPRDKQKLKFK